MSKPQRFPGDEPPLPHSPALAVAWIGAVVSLAVGTLVGAVAGRWWIGAAAGLVIAIMATMWFLLHGWQRQN
ncbi:hypothetical protein GXW83_17500 [Streptacidiphilus sp. PB12-B1b]|uniref:hypothetical protein n=1 Tax=Streptacidiphilus sp. PB12-B1b TaxID=2705012 RepID=UPI0015FCFBF9|nr:hypothetical protein [Streptacidiphilus sp. PB12-B1b]QMU77233.1 hypothetical protein GXW83_17500 [Streptacidiphilus sp. PB12-B1b]